VQESFNSQSWLHIWRSIFGYNEGCNSAIW